jgi:hypothetical protein
MDQATQQNSALVEQMAAAASGLKSQASDLVEVVATFKLDPHQSPKHMPHPKVRASVSNAATFKGTDQLIKPFAGAPASKVAPKQSFASLGMRTQLPQPKAVSTQTPAGGDDDWETF